MAFRSSESAKVLPYPNAPSAFFVNEVQSTSLDLSSISTPTGTLEDCIDDKKLRLDSALDLISAAWDSYITSRTPPTASNACPGMRTNGDKDIELVTSLRLLPVLNGTTI